MRSLLVGLVVAMILAAGSQPTLAESEGITVTAAVQTVDCSGTVSQVGPLHQFVFNEEVTGKVTQSTPAALEGATVTSTHDSTVTANPTGTVNGELLGTFAIIADPANRLDGAVQGQIGGAFDGTAIAVDDFGQWKTVNATGLFSDVKRGNWSGHFDGTFNALLGCFTLSGTITFTELQP